jgi:hypothetical protein
MTPLLANAVHGWWTAQNAEQDILARIENEEMLLRIVRDDMNGFQAQIRSFTCEGPSRLIEVEQGVFVVLAWQPRDEYHRMELADVEQLGEHEETTYVIPS